MILSSRKSLNSASSGASATIKFEAVTSDVISRNLCALFASSLSIIHAFCNLL